MFASQWSQLNGLNVYYPIPKYLSLNKIDPLSYRGTALAPASYKLFCGLINNRLTKWVEENNILADEQNVSCARRSTIDHVSTLTTIIE